MEQNEDILCVVGASDTALTPLKRAYLDLARISTRHRQRSTAD